MRKANGILILLLSVIFCIAISHSAHAVSISVGDIITFKDGPGTTAGGEFMVYSGDGVTYLFNTFCIETNEYIDFKSQFIVDSISTEAVGGGKGGGSPDPLDPRTPYLYYMFATGQLSNYRYDDATNRKYDADSLQRAFWYLEQEITSLSDSQALAWIEEATNAAWTDIGNVRVLNISWYGGPNHGKLAQSQLILVPEPSTLLLLGAGLLGLGLVTRWRRRAVLK